MIMAVLGLIGIAILCSILAVVFGKMAIREIDGSNGRLTGRGLARAGLITGYVPVGLVALALLIGAVVGVVALVLHVTGHA
jgi:hypothetical protein